MWSFGEGPIKNLRDSLIAIKRKAHKLIKKKVVYLGRDNGVSHKSMAEPVMITDRLT
jgi:hypothetical protein